MRRQKFTWESSLARISIPLSEISAKTIVLAGPSGAGKTTLAKHLEELTPRIAVVPNYTTRPPRLSDPVGHFVYVSGEQFEGLRASGEFALCRTDPYPSYGYLADDWNSIVAKGRFAVFMFRHSGLEYLARQLTLVNVVLLEPDPKSAVSHSESALDKASGSDAAAVVHHNTTVGERLGSRSLLVLRNEYRGAAEIQNLARRILAFVRR